MRAVVWWADLNASGATLGERWLDEAERGRADRYRFEDDRARFVLGSALARLAAGAVLGLPAAEVPLERRCERCGEPHGRLRIAARGAPDVSVTHAGALVGVALCAGGRIGLDVEPVPGRGLDVLTDLRHAFAPGELDALRRLDEPDRLRAGLRLWTRKEAALKAAGLGLAVPPQYVEVSAPHRPAAVVAWPLPESEAPALVDLEPRPDHVSACAAIGRPEALVVESRDGAALLESARR